MQNIDGVVEQYLKRETNYALMLSGEWGTGKTYYYKSVLSKLISNTPLAGDASKKYKPVLISLYGLKSTEDIQTAILISLYPILGNTWIKAGAGLVKSLFKGFMTMHGGGDIAKQVLETKVDKKDLIGFKELLICFDDLERISPNFKLEEVIGFINSLVENENAKVHIIANEGKLNQQEFIALKEKTIGNIIEFNPDLLGSSTNIINHYFNNDEKYKEFLEKNQSLLVSVFQGRSNNLRILYFALSYFQTIFEDIENNISKDEALSAMKDEILVKLFRFSLSVFIEFKNGEINYKMRKGLEVNQQRSISQLMAQAGISKKEKTDEPSYLQLFNRNYYEKDKFTFYPAIYDFLTGGDSFHIDELLLHLREIYHVEDQKIAPCYKLLGELSFQLAMQLSNKDYLEKTKQLLGYAIDGEFSLEIYPQLFYMIYRFGNPLRIKPANLERKIIKGMEKGIAHFRYKINLDMYFTIDPNSENIENITNIMTACLAMNKKVMVNEDTASFKLLEEIFYSDIDVFSERISDQANNYLYKPVFSIFDVNKFYSHLLRSDNSALIILIRIIRSRSNNYTNEFRDEASFWNPLLKKIIRKSQALSGSGPRGYILAELTVSIQDYLKAIEISSSHA